MTHIEDKNKDFFKKKMLHFKGWIESWKKMHLAKIKSPLKKIMQNILCFGIFTALVDEEKVPFHSLSTLVQPFLPLQWANNHQLFSL